MLKRHLRTRHELSADQYKRRWNLPSDYPMTAPNYSERRSQFAKKIGLGRKPAQAASATTTEKSPRRRAASKTITTRTDAKTASPQKASARTSNAARIQVRAKNASARTHPKKASNGSPSRKSSLRPRSKAASAARRAATA